MEFLWNSMIFARRGFRGEFVKSAERTLAVFKEFPASQRRKNTLIRTSARSAAPRRGRRERGVQNGVGNHAPKSSTQNGVGIPAPFGALLFGARFPTPLCTPQKSRILNEIRGVQISIIFAMRGVRIPRDSMIFAHRKG